MDTRFKISYHQKQTPPRYIELEEQVKPFAKDIAFRWSYRDVPHLLVELGKGIVYSLCYFKGGKLFVIAGLFFAYGTWNLIKSRFATGKVYDQAREDLEKVRQEMHMGEPNSEVILRFNQLAKRLRVPEYD